jgi:hypothetical protein
MATDGLRPKKNAWIHEIFPNLRSRKQADYDPTPKMIHFITERRSFAAKLPQLKLNMKCTCSKEQTSLGIMSKERTWTLTQQRTRINKNITDRHNQREFQLLLKKDRKEIKERRTESRTKNRSANKRP